MDCQISFVNHSPPGIGAVADQRYRLVAALVNISMSNDTDKHGTHGEMIHAALWSKVCLVPSTTIFVGGALPVIVLQQRATFKIPDTRSLRRVAHTVSGIEYTDTKGVIASAHLLGQRNQVIVLHGTLTCFVKDELLRRCGHNVSGSKLASVTTFMLQLR